MNALYRGARLDEALGISSQPWLSSAYLNPLVAQGYIAQTLPEKPKSPLQRYRLLRKGKDVLACAQFKKALLKAHIQWEKSTATTVLFLVTAGTVEEHFEDLFRVCRLNRALIGRPAAGAGAITVSKAVSGQPVVLPHDAAGMRRTTSRF